MATIALRNSPGWNCHLLLKLYPKRERLRRQFRKSHASRQRRRRKLAKWRDFKGGLAGTNWQANAFQADLVAVVIGERVLDKEFHLRLLRHFDGNLRFLGSARHPHRKRRPIMK